MDEEDASLLVLFVSDEEEQSTANYPSGNKTLLIGWMTKELASMLHQLLITTLLCLHAIVVPYTLGIATWMQQIIILVRFLDICSSDWSAGVLDAANGAVPYSSYPLSHVPLYTENIVVFVDGVVYHDAYWDYVSASNRIDFILEPPGGSLVEIAYHY